MEINQAQLINEYNLPLRVIYCIQYIKDNNISKEQIKEDFRFIRKIEKTYMTLFNNYVETNKIILSSRTNNFSIKNYKKRGETGTIMAIRYLINMLKYEYNITLFDLNNYNKIIKKYFNHNYNIWFEYNKYNIYRYSSYYVNDWSYKLPTADYTEYTDKKYYKLIKNIMGY
jgi:ABC-type Fe3+/spermidine/putrescine transport system ATPase subunit